MRADLCSGCGLCASVSGGAIAMGEASPGYSRPTQTGPVDAAAEAAIAAACPGSGVAPWPKDQNLHPYWGPWREVLTGYAQDPVVRHKASSGGVITALLAHALSSGAAQAVLHVRADPDNPTGNVTTLSTTAGEVLEGAGSRYSASSPLDQIRQVLDRPGRFAFAGKPCDVSALRRLARVDRRVDERLALAVSFFCAGVPSRRGADRILDAMGVTRGELAAFRYRGEGWPGTAAATTRDGRIVEMSYEDSWGGHLSKEIQFRCKICPDAVGGVADIACGDAWYGGESGYPTFEEQDGRSLIMVRTVLGSRFFDDARSAGAVIAESLPIEEIDLMQPSQARRKRLVQARTAALRALLKRSPDMTGTCVAEAAGRAAPGEWLYNFLGTVRRTALARKRAP